MNRGYNIDFGDRHEGVQGNCTIIVDIQTLPPSYIQYSVQSVISRSSYNMWCCHSKNGNPSSTAVQARVSKRSRPSRLPTPLPNTTNMSTFLPRAARSALLEASSGSITRVIRSQSPALRAGQHISRTFTTKPRQAATPASSYARPASATAAKASSTTTASSPAAKKQAIDDQSILTDLTSGMADEPLIIDEGSRQVDWSRSFHGLSAEPFSKEAADVLMAPIPFDDVEVKPDGIIYLPEIKYRRILNRAFGPGGWGLAPRGETIVTGKSITREYALLAHGRYVTLPVPIFPRSSFEHILILLVSID
jgi:hypothetical protein